ncbi:hypothetical protein DRQ25_18440 [Candidatus Fermentibacteria bacterium]|nr:MAG: hypothetical protein DRQ25_18440 [Candidatus Fermentibacteria bacterium]
MLVNIVETLNEISSFELKATSIKEVLMLLKVAKGHEFTNNLITSNYKYILVDSSERLEPIGLLPEVIFTDLAGYDTLYIIKETAGEGAIIVAAVLGTTVAALSTTALIVAAVINIVISIAVGFLVSLLSPTPEFSSDPSQAQLKQSSLFNGAPLIREQGGSVPLVFGNPFAGGVLISSGVSTEDV